MYYKNIILWTTISSDAVLIARKPSEWFRGLCMCDCFQSLQVCVYSILLLAIWYDLLQHKCTGWHYNTLGQQLWEQPPTQGSLAKLLSDVTQQCHHKPTLHKLSPYTLPTMARPNTTHHHHNLATAPSYRTSYATGQRHFLTFCCTIKVSPLPASKWQQHYLQQCWATN